MSRLFVRGDVVTGRDTRITSATIAGSHGIHDRMDPASLGFETVTDGALELRGPR